MPPHALRFGVGLHQRDLFIAASAQAHVRERDVINREETAGCPVFRSHIGDSGAVSQRQRIQTVAVEFNKFPHHAKLAQHLGDGEHEVGGGNPFTQLAGQLEANDIGNQHGDRLSEHCRFRFDTANAPPQYAQTVNHSGMGIGTDQGVRIGHPFIALQFAPHRLPQVFKVDLMANTGARWHYAEAAERLLPPA